VSEEVIGADNSRCAEGGDWTEVDEVFRDAGGCG